LRDEDRETGFERRETGSTLRTKVLFPQGRNQHFFVRKLPGLVLGIDQLAVHHHVEDAAATGYE